MTRGHFFSSKTTVFETPWFNLEEVRITTGSEKQSRPEDERPHYRVVEPPGVICVLLSPDGDFIMVRQPRPAIGRYTYEFPAGGIDANETPAEAARREVLEEAGVRLSSLHLIGTTQPLPSRIDSFQSLFLGVSTTRPEQAETENDMKVVVVPRPLFLDKMIGDGMHCAIALGGIKLAELLYSFDLFKDPMNTIIEKLELGDQKSPKAPVGTGF